MTTGNLDAQVRETHTGIVVLLGDRAFKAKKSIVTGVSGLSARRRGVKKVCEREVTLNRRLAPDSYQGVGHFSGPVHGTAEPVIVMQRYPDSIRLASLVTNGHAVEEHLARIAEVLASFHADAARNPAIDAEGEGSCHFCPMATQPR
jgi:aminoglycoside phosphotransferase family enzyme